MKRDQKKVCTFFIVLFLISIPIQQSVAEKQFLDQDEDTIINENYEYIIITDSSLAHVFQRLISYKSNYISSKLVTLDQIIHNPTYYGRDTQEKIRSFISYAHENWDTTFVLLGGDDSIIPHRGLYAEMIDWKGNTIQSSIPSDMYYGCLNGTWDSDNDFIFGEQEKYSIADEADWYAEVYIGRAPVTNSFEASIFINKVISFETSKKPNSIQLHQSGLNPENNPSSSRIVENLARWIPKDEFTTEKFFAVFQNITVDKWVQSFNEGKLIIQHAGNGNAYQYDLDNINDNEIWTISDISKLRNRFYPIHISLACHSGDFTVDTCIAEEMLLYPYGGASACIFNTDFGATDPENAHRYSGEFLERMFYEIFVNTTNHLGKIVQKSKEYFADKAAVDSMYRWVYYSINLLGDPETPLFEQRDYQSSSIVSVNKEFTESLAGWNVTRFNSIQAAIDAVDEGGTVLVYNGNYDEQITISKSLYLYGTNRNFLDYEPYSGFTTITGNGYENVVTVTSDNVFIDGFIIENGGLDKAGIYLNNVNNSYIYRSSIVSNLGNGIFMDSCNSCYIYESSISFNQKNGIVLNDSHHNHFEGLTVAYNKKNGLILHVSNNNHIVGQSSCWQSSFDFYTSKIFLKNQHLDLKRYKDLTTFIQLFILEYSQDLKQRLFYFPVYPPVKSENLVNTDYFYIANNKEGVTLHTSFNNTLKYIWIENKNEGIRIINSSIYPNFIISNFIYKNKAGINATNSLVTSIFINNLYDNDNALLLNNCTGIPISNKGLISFIIGGNVIINTKKTLPRFEWIFLDKTTNLIFIDLISLTFVAGYAITSSLLTIAILFSSMFSTPLLTVMLSTIFFLISISPLLIRRIKINQPQPVFNMGY